MLAQLSRYCALSVFGSRVWRIKWSRDHLIPRRPFPIGGPLEPSPSLTFSEIFNGECNAEVYTTSKQRSRSFILLPIDFSYATSYAVNSNFCCRSHHLATIHNVTDDGRNTVAGLLVYDRLKRVIKRILFRDFMLHNTRMWDTLALLCVIVRETNEPYRVCTYVTWLVCY